MPKMGRPKINGQITTMLRVPDGVLDRVKEVLEDGEKQAEFLRLAVIREVERRERRGHGRRRRVRV